MVLFNMKFSIRVAAIIFLCVAAVVLYASQWFSKGSIGALIWKRSHEGHSHSHHDHSHSHHGHLHSHHGHSQSHDQPLDFKQDDPQPGVVKPVQNVVKMQLPDSMTQQCEIGKPNAKTLAHADVRSWEILQNLSPDSRDGYRPQMAGGNRAVPDPAADAKVSKRPLKVILVPHSHCDPGWHKTVEGYFEDQVKPTLDNMVEKLRKFPKMTFIWAESVFLSLWWSGIDENVKAEVRRLMKEGRFEIVVGSWVVPDEANPHYYALVDQMIEGHQWLWNNIGTTPNNTWALDPFGYSSGLPYLYKMAGFENMVILRVHEHVKNELIKQKALEFKWRQAWDGNGEHDIRTQMMPYKLYNIKHTCGPDHHVCLLFDFRQIPGEISESRAEPITQFNVDRLAKILLGQYHKKAKLFRHNVLLVPLGDDFRYDRNIEWDQQYKNYMMLFNHMNAQKEWNVQARFGTLQDYFNELDAEMKLDPSLKLPVVEGDFFPYTDEHNDFWTGYFTSRAYDKNLGREVESHVRAADILNALATAASASQGRRYQYLEKNLRLLELSHQALGLFQHHDAITGTARSYVVSDYERRLRRALEDTQDVIRNAAQFLLTNPVEPKKFTIDIDDAYSLRSVMRDRKVVRLSEMGTDVVLANTLSFNRHELVHLLVSSDTVEIIDKDGYIIPSQISPVWRSMELVNDKFELMFYVDVPAMGMSTYKVRATPRDKGRKNTASVIRLYNTQDYRVPQNIRFQILPPGQSIVLENEQYRLRFSHRTGLMHSVTTKKTIHTSKLNMQYLMYKSRGSGAYIFHPAGPAIDNEFSVRPPIRVITGPLVSEVHIAQRVVTSKVSVFNTTLPLSNAISIENTVDMRDFSDKELVMRFGTDIATNGTFFTDINGLEMTRRKRNPRFSVEANYYPMTAMAFIQDGRTRMTVATAQPLGVTSPTDGGLEVMLDRRLTYDDGRGLGEGVLDNKLTPSRFMLFLEHPASSSSSGDNTAARENAKTVLPQASLTSLLAADALNYPLFTLFATNNSAVHVRHFQGFSGPLPCDTRVVGMRTLRAESPKQAERVAVVLHRQAYECAFPLQSNQCPAVAATKLQTLFKHSPVVSAKEATLSLMHDRKTLAASESVSINPMELKSFICHFR